MFSYWQPWRIRVLEGREVEIASRGRGIGVGKCCLAGKGAGTGMRTGEREITFELTVASNLKPPHESCK